MLAFARRHVLALAVLVLGVLSFALFTWAEWHYYRDQSLSHHEKPKGFWSSEHLHDWIYNAASNWQSEMLFGVLIIVVLHGLAGKKDADQT